MPSPGAVSYNAEFTADTGSGTQSLKDYQNQIRAVKEEIRQQSADAKQNYQQQMLAAKAAGASTQELTKIGQQYAQSQLAIKNTQQALTDSILKGNFSALESEKALDVVRKQAIATIEAQTVAIKAQAAANASGHTISNQTAASGFVQLADGRGGIRTVENFLGNTLGLGGVFGIMFPVIGAIQAGKLLVDLGEKLKSLHDRAGEVGEALGHMTDESHVKSELMVADIELQTSKLQDQRDKIAGHPGDGLRTAILEAKKADDEFLISLRATSRELDEIFQKQHVGSVAAWFSDTNSTSKAEGDIHDRLSNFDKDQERIRSEMAARQAQAKTPDELDAVNKELQRRLSESARNVAKEFRQKQKDLRSDNLVMDVDAKSGQIRYRQTNRNDDSIQEYGLAAEKLEGTANVYDARNHMADMGQQVKATEQKKEQERQAKEAASAARRGSREALEAAKQAQAELKAQWNTELLEAKDHGKLSHDQLAQFWLDRVNQTKQGSEAYKFANDQWLKERAAAADDESTRAAHGYNMQRQFQAAGLTGLSKGALTETSNAYAKGQADAARTGMDLRQAQEDIALSARQTTIEFDRQHGTLSNYDAAVQLQQVHTEQYTNALKRLQEQLAAVQPGPDADAQRNNINRQIAELNGKRTGQEMQDNAAVAQQTVGGALKQANQTWMHDTQDIAPQIASLYGNVFNGMNGQLTNILTGQKTSWSQFFAGIAAQVANMGLRNLEAGLMSSAGGALTGLPLIGGLFGGFRANGGPVEAGKTYIVGEHGPEPVTFGSSGLMGTNRDFMRSGSGGTQHFYTIHVPSGITPEQFDQSMKQIIPGVQRKATEDALRAMSERSMRRPAVAAR